MKSAFVWCEHFSPHQVHKIDKIDYMDGLLRSEVRHISSFCRTRVMKLSKEHTLKFSSAGVWTRKLVNFSVVVRPLVSEYAIALYSNVIEEAAQRYPCFFVCRVVDGAEAGERRIIFMNNNHSSAAEWIKERMYELCRKKRFVIKERYSAVVSENDQGTQKNIEGVVALNRSEINSAVIKEVMDDLNEGREIVLNDDECCPDVVELEKMITTVTLPELVFLNWEKVKKPLSDADILLFKGIKACSIAAVEAALSGGADPNAAGDDGNVPLTSAVYCVLQNECESGNDGETFSNQPPNTGLVLRMIDLLVSAGASINWAQPKELTPLAAACSVANAEVIEHLCALGADPSISVFFDEKPGELATAWYYAEKRREPLNCFEESDPSAWNALKKYFHPPQCS